MKKILSLVLGISFIMAGSAALAVSPVYQAPNVGNMDFYPMMQYQMEKQETLDFANDPEHYKQKRDEKDNQNKVRSSNFNPNYSPNYGGTYLHPVHPVQMQFTKGDDGNIKIQGVHTNNSTIIDTDNK